MPAHRDVVTPDGTGASPTETINGLKITEASRAGGACGKEARVEIAEVGVGVGLGRRVLYKKSKVDLEGEAGLGVLAEGIWVNL